MLLQEKPTLRLKTKVKFPNRRNSADYRVSFVFTSYGKMTVVSNSVVTETSRIHEFKEARNSFSFFQTNKHILSLDTVRAIISRRNLARVLSTYRRFLTLCFPPK